MTGTLMTTANTENDSIALSNLRITEHRPISRLGAVDVANVTQPEPADAPGASQGDLSGPASWEDPYASKVKRREHVQFAALCFCLFLAGYNDGKSLFEIGFPPRLIFGIGSTGPLLPTIQRHYHVRMHHRSEMTSVQL